jgi:dihydroorotate dehydrogenase
LLPGLSVNLFGLEFPNPLGLAAGFDKNAEVPDAMLALGFGFVEIGSVTPKPQDGNPRPRLFRLAEDEAVINRMGFNNEGHDAVLLRLLRRKPGGIIGINLGANKDSEDRAGDYVKGIATFSKVASYFTINISSPNTPGLRTLQSEAELRPLLRRVHQARNQAERRLPVLLKLAPDLSEGDLEIIAACCSGGEVDGVILTNTTVQRPSLHSPDAGEAGGLSGAPLFELSTRQLARFYLLTEGRIPLVGVGGISSAEQAWLKITAGASLLQLYSALVFKGPALIGDILSGLSMRLQKSGFNSLQQAVGSAAASIAHQ